MHIPIRSAAPIVAAALSLISAALAQDTCATAIPIVGGVNGPFSNVGMTASTTLEGAPVPTCVGVANFDKDIWGVFVSPCSGSATFSSCAMPSGDTIIVVYDGTCGALTQLGCNDDSCGLRSSVTVPVVGGTSYYVRLDTFGTGTLTNMSFTVSIASGANADECACAGSLVAGPNAITTVGSTVSTPAWNCAFVTGGDTWYSYTVGGTGCRDVQIDTIGSGLDTALELWSACGGSLIDCNDDIVFPPGESQVNALSVAPGTVLKIRAGMFSGATAAFTLNITETASPLPANDECLGAIPVVNGANGPFNNACATTSTPVFSCSGSAQADLWFDYTAAFTAPHTIDTLGSTFDTIMEVYDACGGASVGCDDDIAFPTNPESQVVVNLTAGVTYKIRVGGFLTARGDITLNIRTGTLGGSITPDTTVSLCPSPASLTVTGDPWIGGTLQINIVGATGLGFTGYGFSPLIPIPSPCGCDIISDGVGGLGFFQFLTNYSLPIPVDPFLIGAGVQFQGLDVFPSSGGCSFAGIPFGATNIWSAVIG